MATTLLATGIPTNCRSQITKSNDNQPKTQHHSFPCHLFSSNFNLCLSSTFHLQPIITHPHATSSSASSSSHSSTSSSSIRLYVSGLSFRTTKESLRNAFQQFGELVEVNLVMDKIAKRPRGFAFLRYATDEESKQAIEGMHGKFLDGRVIFVEVAKPKLEVQKNEQTNRF